MLFGLILEHLLRQGVSSVVDVIIIVVLDGVHDLLELLDYVDGWPINSFIFARVRVSLELEVGFRVGHDPLNPNLPVSRVSVPKVNHVVEVIVRHQINSSADDCHERISVPIERNVVGKSNVADETKNNDKKYERMEVECCSPSHGVELEQLLILHACVAFVRLENAGFVASKDHPRRNASPRKDERPGINVDDTSNSSAVAV